MGGTLLSSESIQQENYRSNSGLEAVIKLSFENAR